MTTTTKTRTRTVAIDEALTSAVGYLTRSSIRLATDHNTGKLTPASLRWLADGLHIIGGRLLDAAAAMESGDASITVSDAMMPVHAQLDPHAAHDCQEAHCADGDC